MSAKQSKHAHSSAPHDLSSGYGSLSAFYFSPVQINEINYVTEFRNSLCRVNPAMIYNVEINPFIEAVFYRYNIFLE